MQMPTKSFLMTLQKKKNVKAPMKGYNTKAVREIYKDFKKHQA